MNIVNIKGAATALTACAVVCAVGAAAFAMKSCQISAKYRIFYADDVREEIERSSRLNSLEKRVKALENRMNVDAEDFATAPEDRKKWGN